MAEQRISLGAGHFIVELDPGVDTYRIATIDHPGRCTPELEVSETPGSVEVRRLGGCPDDPYASVQINPAWAGSLVLHLKAGQLDLKPSLLAATGKFEAKVKVGDILGHSKVRRSWLFGANLALDAGKPGLAVLANVGAGQTTLLGK